MLTPATAVDFLALVRKSGLLEPQQFEGYLDRLDRTGGRPAEPAALAARMVQDGLLTPFQADQLLRGKHRGFVLGKYRILDKLGAGGMATIFLCEHLRMNRRVALKVLPPDRANDPVALARFYREAQAVARLDHPNIIRAHDVDTEGSMHFLVMEYAEGVDLQTLVDRHGRLGVARAADYVRQVACGLDHAHRAGVVHRDIKPANLLLDRQGVIKILDMGLARFFHDDGLTRENEGAAVLGTADYMSPEQGRDSHDVDTRSDIYSLGATFYFLLVGRAPFAEGNLNQKLLWHQMRMPTPVHTLRSEVPAGLSAAVERMMAKDVRQRYQTPAEVMAALTPWTRGPVPPPAANELPSAHLAAWAARLSGAEAAPPASPGEADSNVSLTHPRSPAAAPNPQAIAALPTAALAPAPTVVDLPEAPSVTRRDGVRLSLDNRLRANPLLWLGWKGWLLLAALPVLAMLFAVVVGGALAVVALKPKAPPPEPRAPRNLRATAHADGVELQWDAPPGPALGYRIERATDPNFREDLSLLATTDAGRTTYLDPAADAGKPFYYRVRTVGAASESVNSNPAWPPPSYANGFTRNGLLLNKGAAVSGTRLRLTDDNKNLARSAFYHQKVPIRAFTTSFRFRIAPGANTADGFTFCIQGAGPTEVGTFGGGLGYENIPRSVAVKFDLWNNDGEGSNSTGLFARGQKPSQPGSINLTPSGIDLHSGRVYDVTLTYQAKRLDVQITDVEAPAKTFRTTFAVDIQAAVGGPTAYVGFTASTGGVGVVQEILSWAWSQDKES